MMKQKVGLKTALNLEQNGKMFLLTGFVLIAELEKKILRWFLWRVEKATNLKCL